MIRLDTETYSETPIKNGTYRYTGDCECLIVTWAIDDGPVQCWDVTAGSAMPQDLAHRLRETDETIQAHNSMFDRQVVKHALGIDTTINRWQDTMVKAYLHGLPGGLDLLCDILHVGTDLAKQKDGKKLIHLFCKPQPFKFGLKRVEFATKKAYDEARALALANWAGRATRETHPEEWARFIEYAVADISAMREVDKKLPKWNYSEGKAELALWHLDQKINDRGFYVDQDLANAAISAVADRKEALAEETRVSTDGEVESTTKRDQLLPYLLEAYGVSLPDLQKSTVQRRLDDPDIPEALRELLRIRLQSSSTAASKYLSLMKAVNDDSRLRGTKQFAGAFRSARWAGRTFQPDNLPRPSMHDYKGDMIHPDFVDAEIDAGIDALLAGAADLVVPDIIGLANSAIRKCIAAPKGKKLVIADLANIEGRGLAFLAGEDWKLQAFRDYDAGTGPDLYKLAYAKAFAIKPEEVDKHGRSVGKVLELMLGYEGGVGAFLTGAATYHVDLEDMSRRARPSIPEDVWDESLQFYDWCIQQKRSTFGLSLEVFCVCDSLKRMWRRAHPATASLWKELAESVKAAIVRPGTTFACRRFKVRRDGAWLRIVLPSGRALCYPSPELSNSSQISFMGVNQYTRKWERINTYSGKLVENCTQAFARDILAYNMPAVEAAGYEIVLHVHDELVCEVPDSPAYSAEALAGLMVETPAWARGIPLAAEGFESYRYRK